LHKKVDTSVCHHPALAAAGSVNAGARRHVTPVNTGVSKEIPAYAGMTEKGAGMTGRRAGMTTAEPLHNSFDRIKVGNRHTCSYTTN